MASNIPPTGEDNPIERMLENATHRSKEEIKELQQKAWENVIKANTTDTAKLYETIDMDMMTAQNTLLRQSLENHYKNELLADIDHKAIVGQSCKALVQALEVIALEQNKRLELESKMEELITKISVLEHKLAETQPSPKRVKSAHRNNTNDTSTDTQTEIVDLSIPDPNQNYLY